MTALKRTVRTRRGVEPTGRPARREVERGRRARTNSSRTFAQRAGRPRSRAARPGGATVVAPAEVAMIRRVRGIMGRRRRAVVVVNQSSFEIRHISNISGGKEKGEEIVEGRPRPQRAVMYHQGCSSSSSASIGLFIDTVKLTTRSRTLRA